MTMIGIGTNIRTGREQKWREIHQFGVHIIGAKPRYGKCISGGSKLRLDDGSFISVENLYNDYKNKKVLSCNKDDLSVEFKSIIAMSRRHVETNDRVLCIKTRGNHKLTVTDNHKVFVWNNGFVEKDAKDLKVGEYLISYRKSGINNDRDLVKDCEIIVLGYLLGDGSLQRNNLRFVNSDRDVLNDYVENLELCGFDDIKINYYKNGCADTVDIRVSAEVGRVNYQEEFSKVKLFYDKFGLKNENGLNSYTKYIPEIVFRTSNSQKAIFLNRLFSCDGHVNINSYQIEYSSNSFDLIVGVIQLLLDLGIDSKVKTEFKCAIVNGKRGKLIKTYRLFVCGVDNLSRFNGLISFVNNRKFFDLIEVVRCNICKGNATNELLPNINDDLRKIFEEFKPIERYLHLTTEVIGIRRYLTNKRTPTRYSLNDKLRFMIDIRKDLLQHDSYKKLVNLIKSDLIFYEIEKIEDSLQKHDFVYDLEVDDNNNLFVGDTTQFLVHNSKLAEYLIINIADLRRTLVFDYAGEHKNLMYPNFFDGDKQIRGIPDLFVIENLGFMISDFDRPSDWTSMGFPEGASNLMAMLASHTELHGNEPNLMLRLLSSLPSTNEEIDEFVSKFPSLGIDNRINQASKDSAITRFRFVMMRGLFCTIDDIESGYKTYIDDFYDMVKSKNHVLINFGLSGNSDAFIGRAYVGKILERLASPPERLKSLNLAIFVEEADILFPNTNDFDLSSNRWMSLYVLKYQKYWVEMFFIVQDLVNLHQDIVKNFYSMILGIVPIYGIVWEYKELINRLRWDYNSNYREFILIEIGDLKNASRNVFTPHIVPCLT